MDDHPSTPWQVDPETLTALRLEKAKAALEAGDSETALVEAEELLDEVPDHPVALLVSAEASLALHNPAMARAAFERVLARGEPQAHALEGLAVARFELVDFPGALEAARAATAVEPSRARAWYYEGLLLERTGDRSGSLRCFDRAQALEPGSWPHPRNFSEAAWEEALQQGRRMLPGPIRAFYAQVPLRWEQFPPVEELLAHSPPLSPFSYALYEGQPPQEGDPWTQGPPAVRLFRGNLRHGVRRTEDLARRIADALMHEAAAWLGVPENELL